MAPPFNLIEISKTVALQGTTTYATYAVLRFIHVHSLTIDVLDAIKVLVATHIL